MEIKYRRMVWIDIREVGSFWREFVDLYSVGGGWCKNVCEKSGGFLVRGLGLFFIDCMILDNMFSFFGLKFFCLWGGIKVNIFFL